MSCAAREALAPSALLTHTQIERRGPGFLAERFVKPPVDIVVEFPYVSFLLCAARVKGVEKEARCALLPAACRLPRCARVLHWAAQAKSPTSVPTLTFLALRRTVECTTSRVTSEVWLLLLRLTHRAAVPSPSLAFYSIPPSAHTPRPYSRSPPPRRLPESHRSVRAQTTHLSGTSSARGVCGPTPHHRHREMHSFV